MALTDYEKQKIIQKLEDLDDVARALILASIDAFAEWLANVLYEIFLKIQHALNKFWKWLRSQFD